MRAVFVCQLPEDMQAEIRTLLERLLLYQCGSRDKAEEFFGRSIEEAVELGMDEKIADLDCAVDDLRGAQVPDGVQKDMDRLLELVRERVEIETDKPYIYRTKEQIGETEYHELVNVVWRHGEDDFALWQVQLPVSLVRNILNTPEFFSGDVDAVMDSLPLEPEKASNTLHFVFPRGGELVCCTKDMGMDFFDRYDTQGASVRADRAYVRNDILYSAGIVNAPPLEAGEEIEQ